MSIFIFLIDLTHKHQYTKKFPKEKKKIFFKTIIEQSVKVIFYSTCVDLVNDITFEYHLRHAN